MYHMHEHRDDREFLGAGNTRPLPDILQAVSVNSLEHQNSKDVSVFFCCGENTPLFFLSLF